MLKLIALAALLATPTMIGAVPTRIDGSRPAALFNTAELNNLARLDDTTQPARVRKMQTEIALLRDQVGRMKLDRLIETVLTDAKVPGKAVYR